MLKKMTVKIHESNADTNNDAFAFQGSFVEDNDTKNLKESEWEEMVRNWIDIEEDPDVIGEEIEEAMDDMVDEPEDPLADNEDDEAEWAPPEEVDTVSDSAATEALILLNNYCLQQEVETEISSMVASLERKIRGMRLGQRKNSPSLLQFFRLLPPKKKKSKKA